MAVLALTACLPAGQGPLSAVEANPPARSPELRDPGNRLDVRYRLNSAAQVSTHIQAADGQRWSIYDRAARPAPGEYVLHFDGTVPGPGPNERRVLPSGDYQIVLDVDASGTRQQAAVPLAIRDADVQTPELIDLAVVPDRISPDFDALDDIANVSFGLAKEAGASLFLDRPLANGATERVWLGDEHALQVGAQRLMWDGLANGQPVPGGSYILGVRARDAAGNVVERGSPIVVDEAGAAEASIVTARIGPRQIIRGERVCMEVLVRNTGGTVLRTSGPDPGYVYNSMDT